MPLWRFAPERLWKLLRPDAESVWLDERVRRALSWYRMVMDDEAPAKFLLARLVESSENPRRLGLDALRDEARRLRHRLASLVEKARRGYSLEEYWRDARGLEGSWTLLHIDAETARRLASPCRLCERRCSVDRSRRLGACRLDDKVYVHSWFHHLGEEAPLVPSGTIFYGGCNFTCVYCQNYDISQVAPRSGEVVDARRLAQIQELLRRHGARNINHVGGEPTPSLPLILESMLLLRVNVPQIWNSNMYMSLESMELLMDVIDLWLTDFKYGSDKCAFRLSAAPRYFEVVSRNHLLASKTGDMIIRHLVLPGHVDCCTRRVLEWIAANLPRERVLVNIMDQYRPENLVARYPSRWPEIARRPSLEEIERAKAIADELGIVYEPVS